MKMLYNRQIKGIRLIGEEELNIVDETWDRWDADGEWVTKEIPEGHNIIGLQTHSLSLGGEDMLMRVGYVLWSPK